MIISPNKMQTLKAAPNSAYEVILPEFLYHSNKIEGSTFTLDQIETLYARNKVTGDHDFDDIIETKNSFKMFDRMVDTLGVELTPELLIEFETILHKGTTMAANGESGHFKYIPNRIRNSSVQVALPSDIPTAIPALLAEWASSQKDFESISRFHARFEHLHPFQDGNGRIGRLIMMKQCIENGVDLIVIDETHADEYKSWMEIAQTQGNFRFFDEVLRKCQCSFDARMHEIGADILIQYTPETLEEGKRSVDHSTPSTSKIQADLKTLENKKRAAGALSKSDSPVRPKLA